MADSGLRSRTSVPSSSPAPDTKAAGLLPHHTPSPVQHGNVKQRLRMVAFATYFLTSCAMIHAVQLLGSPLYFLHRRAYYSYMAFTKEQFGILLNTITSWFAPTTVRISGDASVAGQLRLTKDGRLDLAFPSRLVMIANHQIYTDWLYMWWSAYAARMHGRIYIILKESIKYIPIIGPGIMFYGFVFMRRNWATDQPRIAHRLQKLRTAFAGAYDPMWLLIFPEGTNLSNNGRANSARWAAKSNQSDLRHALLPRSTGLFFCLQQLHGSVEWVYDCTLVYEGIPPGEYAQDIYTLWSIYFGGRAPRSVNMHWRRFRVADIPLDDAKAFESWLAARWVEKDDLLDTYDRTGRLPPNEDTTGSPSKDVPPYLETSVRNSSRFEFLLVLAPTAGAFVFAGMLKSWLKQLDTWIHG